VYIRVMYYTECYNNKHQLLFSFTYKLQPAFAQLRGLDNFVSTTSHDVILLEMSCWLVNQITAKNRTLNAISVD